MSGEKSKEIDDKREIRREKRQILHVFFYMQNIG